MASADKTPKLGLNQWAAGDDVLRADFNADNAKIDAGVEANKAAAAAAHALAAAQGGQIVSGTYRGTYTADVITRVTLGFRPQAVLVTRDGMFPQNYSGLALRDRDVLSENLWTLQITETGFEAQCRLNGSSVLYPCLGGDMIYRYVAFR